MSNDVLSQDEVDALLQGVDDAIASGPGSEAEGVVRPIDLLTHDPLRQARMPALELVSERFCKSLRVALLNFMGRVPEIAATPVAAMKYADFTAALSQPVRINIAQIEALHGHALIVLDPALVYLLVDNLFGGDGRFQPSGEQRECTPTEQALVQRILTVVLSEFEKAWQDLYPLTFAFLRTESNPQRTGLRPDDAVVAMKFTIGCGPATGTFHIGVPYAVLEPIRHLLQGTGVREEPVEIDERWLRSLSTGVQVAEVELIADLVTVPVTVGQLLSMTVGDVLSVGISDTVTARVDGVPLFDCRFGTLNGQYALRIASVLSPEREAFNGANHA